MTRSIWFSLALLAGLFLKSAFGGVSYPTLNYDEPRKVCITTRDSKGAGSSTVEVGWYNNSKAYVCSMHIPRDSTGCCEPDVNNVAYDNCGYNDAFDQKMFVKVGDNHMKAKTVRVCRDANGNNCDSDGTGNWNDYGLFGTQNFNNDCGSMQDLCRGEGNRGKSCVRFKGGPKIFIGGVHNTCVYEPEMLRLKDSNDPDICPGNRRGLRGDPSVQATEDGE